MTRWEFVAGDGRPAPATGSRHASSATRAPPRGVYRAVLIVHLGPSERLLTYVDVRVR